jgi:hypothetical protein
MSPLEAAVTRVTVSAPPLPKIKVKIKFTLEHPTKTQTER